MEVLHWNFINQKNYLRIRLMTSIQVFSFNFSDEVFNSKLSKKQ